MVACSNAVSRLHTVTSNSQAEMLRASLFGCIGSCCIQLSQKQPRSQAFRLVCSAETCLQRPSTAESLRELHINQIFPLAPDLAFIPELLSHLPLIWHSPLELLPALAQSSAPSASAFLAASDCQTRRPAISAFLGRCQCAYPLRPSQELPFLATSACQGRQPPQLPILAMMAHLSRAITVPA